LEDDYEGMLEIKKKKNSICSSEIMSLKVIDVFQGSAAAAPENCQPTVDGLPRKASQDEQESLPEMSMRLITGILDASMEGDPGSVAFILSLDQFIVANKVNL
jgi:hypothetical protein